jgi:hypothetical protein
MVNFIKTNKCFIDVYIIEQIKNLISEKNKILKNDSFFWLDEPIYDGNRKINRFKPYSYYYMDEAMPKFWNLMDSKLLYEVYIKLKNNKFHVWKKLHDGKTYKTRVK